MTGTILGQVQNLRMKKGNRCFVFVAI